MSDGFEVTHGLDPLVGDDPGLDPDADGLTNLEEFLLETNPNNPDTDGDGMPDGWEAQYNYLGAGALNPLVNDAAGDPDNDGLSNLQEYQYSLGVLGAGFAPLDGLHPRNEDTDNDGMQDGWEFHFTPDLNPLVYDAEDVDADSDGMTNLAEYQFSFIYFGNALFDPADGLDPTHPDSDGDGMGDGWEALNELDPWVDDAADELDGDGLSNLQEYMCPQSMD